MNSTKVRAKLEEFKKDKRMKLVDKRVDPEYAHYEFQDGETVETDYEVKTNFIRVFLSFEHPERDRITSSSRGASKLLCVNGPHAGQRRTIENAAGYVQFNAGTRHGWRVGKRQERFASAVLVHLESIRE